MGSGPCDSTKACVLFFPHRTIIWCTREVLGVTEEDFLALCVSLSRFYRGSTLESYRAAVVWRQLEDQNTDQCWSQTSRFRRRFKGVQNICLQPKPRGSITLAQMRSLTNYCKDQGELAYGQGFAVAYFGFLRHRKQLVNLEKIDIEANSSDALIKIRGGKGRQHYIVDTVVAPEVCHLLMYLKSSSSHLALFPNWDKVKANRIRSHVANLLQWNSHQTWSFHCLRHGCAGHLTREGTDLTTRLRRVRWMSEFTATHYSMEQSYN